MVKRARRMSDLNDQVVACLLPNTTDVLWFHAEAVPFASELWFYRGRIGFIDPRTLSPVPANPVGSVLLIFLPSSEPARPRIGQLDSRTGKPFMSVDREYWTRSLERRSRRNSLQINKKEYIS